MVKIEKNIKNQSSLKITDFSTSKFIKALLTFQLVIFILIGLNFLNIHIPVFQEIFFSIYLIFIPGIIVLRILKIHDIDNVNALLYSIGISISIIMFVGFILDFVGPYLGISNSLSYLPVIIVFNALNIILMVISYFRDFKYKNSISTELLNLNFSKNLFLILLPFLAIFGTYQMNYYNENYLLLSLIIIISILPILVVFNKIDEKYYPLAILSISISLVLHTSLISNHIWGYDLHNEYYIAKLVITNGFWNYNYNTILNSMLSIVILPPLYSSVSGLSLNWTYKIVYPLIFSLVPLALYQIYQNFTGKKVAFLASFFFMSFFIFYSEMLQLARQEIAELFFVLLILLIFDHISPIKKSILCVMFTITLITSHYSLSYIFTGMIIFTLLFTYLKEKKIFKKFLKFIEFRCDSKLSPMFISTNFVLLVLVLLLAWYLFTAGSTPFNALTRVLGNIYHNISSDFFNSDTIQGLSVVTKQETSIWYIILKYLNLIFSFFVFLGTLSLLKIDRLPVFVVKLKKIFLKSDTIKKNPFHIKLKEIVYSTSILKNASVLMIRLEKSFSTSNILKGDMKYEYICFVIIALILCFASVTIPYFAISLNVTRLYHITLLILSPFSIIGAYIFLYIIFNLLNPLKILQNENNYLKIIAVLISVFFIFNSGLLFEIFHDNPSSIALSSIKDYPKFSTEELTGASWMFNHTDSKIIYTDTYGRFLLQEYGFRPIVIEGAKTDLLGKNLVYLRSFNVIKNQLYYAQSNNPIIFSSSKVYVEIIRKNLIYSNGECEIYS